MTLTRVLRYGWRAAGKVSFGLDDDATWGPDVKITSSSTYDDNAWPSFTVVKEGNSAVRLYIDGSQVAADTSLGGGGNVSSRVSQSSDDVEEGLESPYQGDSDLTSSDLELIRDTINDLDQEVGLRFQNVTIPQGATITDAYIQFTVDETTSGTTNLTIYGEDTDNAPTFTAADYNITSRLKTTASVAWNNVPAWTSVNDAGADQQTPDISSIIQKIVSRAGWVSGNDIVIIVDGTGSRIAESYYGDSDAAPLLVVDYTVPLGTLTSDSAPLTFGSDEPANADYFNGTIDEVRISDTARSADWIEASYINQNSPSNFYTAGSEEELVIAPGDASGDGVIDDDDVAYIGNAIADVLEYDPACDANEDGNINSLDITQTELMVT